MKSPEALVENSNARGHNREVNTMRRIATYFAVTLSVIVLLGALPDAASAQSGKLTGTVTDSETGETIPGVNVVLVGTQRGAATNPEGEYNIIGITPGTYSVRFSLVGYTTKVVSDLRILSNSTRTLDVELSEGVIEGEGVTVQAERPVIQADQTTSRTVFTNEEISQLPVTNLNEVVSNTAKSYEGFVRGSRRFSTKTVVEGIDVTDDFAQASSINENTRAGYENTIRVDQARQSGTGLFSLSSSGIEEVSVSTGATEASSPAGSGGVIDVTLAEGRGPISGSFSVRMTPKVSQPGPDSLSIYPESEIDAYFAEKQRLEDNGEEAVASLYTWQEDKYDIRESPEMNVDFSVGGSITENLHFAAAGQFFQTEGFLPNKFNRRINAQLKTSYDISGSTELTAVGLIEDNGLWGGWNNRNYAEVWRYYLEGVAQNDGGNYVGSLRLRQVINDNSYVAVQVYRKFARTRYGYPDDNGNGFVEQGEDGDFINFLKTENIAKYNWIGQGPPEEKMFYGGPFPPARSESVLNPRGEPIRAAQPMPHYEDAKRTSNVFKVDYSNQITENHLIEAGVQLELIDISFDQARAELYEFDYTLNNDLDVNGDGVLDIEPFAPVTWDRSPTEFSVYLSDRMEYGDLIVNLGLRTDIVNRDTEKITDYFFPFQRDTVNVDGRTVARNFFRRGEDVPLDVFWNPRIGVSHPIGDVAAVYFSYSRSEELVPYSTLYDKYDGNHTANHFLTFQDPEQDPIVSNDYELGVQWEFIEGWGLDVNAYARSVDNYGRQNMVANYRVPEGEEAQRGFGRLVYQTSAGYADIRGLEMQVQRRPLQIAGDFTLGMTASYTYSTVETNNNTSNLNRFNADHPFIENGQLPFENVNDFRHFPQEAQGGASIISSGYNRNHRALFRGVSTFPYEISMGIDARYESGFLFPKAVNADPRDRELLRAPDNFRIDLRLEKQFTFTDRFGVNVFMDIRNLTDRNNVIAYNTQAPDAGRLLQVDENPGERLVLIDGSPIYGAGRNVYFGTRVRF